MCARIPARGVRARVGARAHAAMKPTTLLERQHRNLQQLCETVERGSASMRESLLPQLAGDLVAHMAVEEQLFYPAACKALHEDEWMREVRETQAQAKQSLDRAFVVPPGGDEFTRTISELRHIVDSHAVSEEELIFPRLEQALDAGAQRDLSNAMMSLYHAKVEAGYPR